MRLGLAEGDFDEEGLFGGLLSHFFIDISCIIYIALIWYLLYIVILDR